MPLYLITPEEVFDAMGQNPDLMEESTPAIQGAIIRAMIKLEGVLHTTLAVQTRKDTFFVSGRDGVPLNHRYTLRLTNGFVKADQPRSVSVCDAEFGEYLPVPNSVFQYERGTVIVPHGSSDDLLGKFIQVTYTSGFAKPKDIPDGVRQALLCYVPLLLLSSSAAVAEPKQQQAIVAKATSSDSIGGDMVAKYHRPTSNALKPIYSEVVG